MLFQKNIVKKYLGLLNEELTKEAWDKYQAYFLNDEIQQNYINACRGGPFNGVHQG